MSTQLTNSDKKSSSNKLNRLAGAYALAAAAAGVSVLAIAEPSAAEVVVTRKTIPIPVSTGTTAEPVAISLANNGVTDLSFTLWGGANPGRTLDFNAPGGNNGVIVGGNFDPYAVALTRGADIGPVENPSFYARGLVELSASSGVNKYCKGFWGSTPKYFLPPGQCGEHKNEYMGVSFRLNGETHYGWVRLTVTTSPDPNGPPLTAKITGYAYETVANKAILAGTAAIKSGTAAENASKPTTHVSVPRNIQNHGGPSLGMLAAGSEGMPLWRREQSSFVQ